ncbi:hypothetical protein BaRGS_00030772, partial [Batillaria attramentaria]
KRRRTKPPQPGLELVMQSRHDVPEEDGSNQSVHLYCEADPPASDGADAAGKRRRTKPPQPGLELVMQSRHDVPEEDGSNQSVHLYCEADPPASDGADAAEDVPPSVCHGPRNPPDDYLNPSASRDEIEEEGSEWKTVPFYQNTQIRNVSATAAAYDSAMTQDDVSPSDSTPTASGVSKNSHTKNCNTDVDKTCYVAYDPRLYENTKPRH